VWPAFVVAGVQSALTQLNNPAKVALLPRLVSPDQLMIANAAESTSRSLSRLIGSPLGGLAVALGGLEAVVVIDGATFVAVAVASALVRADTSSLSVASGRAGVSTHGTRAGLSSIWHHGRLRNLLALLGLAAVAQGFFVVLFVVFVVERLHGGGGEVGLIRGMMAIGGIAGSLLIARWSRRIDASVLLATGFLGMGVLSFLFWNAPAVDDALWLAVALFAVTGVPGAALQIGVTTSVQRASPPEILGRVAGVLNASDAAGTAAGSLVVGLLVDRVQLTVLLNAQASVYLLCGVLALTMISHAAERTTVLRSEETTA
jgi:predicted MFS family arabinose efflux permease